MFSVITTHRPLLQIKVLQVLLPAQSYREFLTSFNNAKAVQRQRHELLKALRSQNEPVVQFKKYVLAHFLNLHVLI